MNNDGFVTIGSDRPRLGVHASFHGGALTVLVPDACVDCSRADLQWDGNGTVRVRMGDSGRYKLGFGSRRTRTLSAQALYTRMSRSLRGQYPVLKVDGCDLYIDVSEGSAESIRTGGPQ